MINLRRKLEMKVAHLSEPIFLSEEPSAPVDPSFGAAAPAWSGNIWGPNAAKNQWPLGTLKMKTKKKKKQEEEKKKKNDDADDGAGGAGGGDPSTWKKTLDIMVHVSASFMAIRQHLHLPGCASPAHATELEAFDLHR